jgi:GT2 family glycosyltransferase
MKKTAVIIASAGRPEVLKATVMGILRQTKAPELFVISTIYEHDWSKDDRLDARIIHIFGRKGIPKQLNAALDLVPRDIEIVFFLDDDVELANDYCERACRWFDERPGLLAFDGQVLKDGSVSRHDALRLLSESPGRTHEFIEQDRIYGCNICCRSSILDKEKFDESLPGYAWLFEFDWIRRVRRHGETGRVQDCKLVHLMAQLGRPPGYSLGYMQVFHPIYLWRKGTIRNDEILLDFVWRNILRNVLGVIMRERVIDRTGRLQGNLSALLHIIKGVKVPTL